MLEHLLYTARVKGGIETFVVVALDTAGLEACLRMPIIMPVRAPALASHRFLGTRVATVCHAVL